MPDRNVMMKRQQVLADFGDFAIRSDDLDAVLTEACRLVSEALGTTRAKVLEIDQARQELLVRAGVGWAPDVVGNVRLPMSERSSETYSIAAAEPVITQEIAREDRFDVPAFMQKAGVVALVNVPIFVPGQRPYGVLQVDSTVPRHFDDGDIQFLRTYASILGPVIDRLHLVDERRTTAERLRESEARHRLLIGSFAQAIWETDPNGVIVEDSPTWRSYTGQSVEEWLGYGRLDAIHPEDRAFAERQWREAIAARGLVDADFRLRAPDGGWRWTNVLAAPVLDAEGRIAKWAAMNFNIDARKQAEKTLRDSEERQAFLLRLSDALRAEPDADAVANRAIQMLLDYLELDRCYITYYRPAENAADFPYQVGNASVPPLPATVRLSDFPDAYEQVLDRTFVIEDDFERRGLSEAERVNSNALGMRAMVASTVRRGEKVLLSSMAAVSSRARRWSPAEIALVEEAAERTWSAIEWARAQVALRESEERVALAIEIGELASWDWDMRTGHVTWNDRHFLMQGYAPGEVTPSFAAWLARVHPDDQAETLSRIEAARDAHQVYAHEFRTLRPEDTILWCAARAHFFYDDAGAPYRMIGVMEDVTGRWQAEDSQAEEFRNTQILQKLGARLVTEDSVATIYEEVLSAAMAIMHARAGTVQKVDPATEQLVVLATRGFSRCTEDHFQRVDAGSATSCGLALRSGDREWFDFDSASPDLDVRLHVADGVLSAQSTPLISRSGAAIGMVSTHWGERGYRPSDRQLRYLDLLARQAADLLEQRAADATLRASEERFQQFARASAAGLWIRDAETLEMEFVSPAVGTIYGTEPDDLLGDARKWAVMIVPEDRDVALAHLEAARTGGTVQHQFRIQRPCDGVFRWIRNTDFPLRDGGHIARVGGIAEDITETRQLVEHQGVLLAELQHRVRNIMGMIRSMANRTAPGANDTEDYRALLEGRLLALARVQALLTRQANAGGSLRDIVHGEVSAQAHHLGQFELIGPDVILGPKAVEVLTLALHELATNALKYGALSVPEGRLKVCWTHLQKRGTSWLVLDWVEEGAPTREPSPRKGFGSELIEARIPYELGGTGKITIEPGGARCHMEFPLKQAESILETDAPLPSTIFGGMLDMTGAADLTGRRVLVVEDEYYMARDTAAALSGAGAEVIGPCPTEEAALNLLTEQTTTHAVLDLNLGGGGPQFGIARQLRRRGVPFIFLTGYDPDAIAPEFADVARLQKPVSFRAIVEAVGAL